MRQFGRCRQVVDSSVRDQKKVLSGNPDKVNGKIQHLEETTYFLLLSTLE